MILYEGQMKGRQYKACADLTNTQKQKINFVDTMLSSLISTLNCGYGGCIYLVDDHNNEFVKVYYRPNDFEGYYVDVTADSLLALTREVISTLS